MLKDKMGHDKFLSTFVHNVFIVWKPEYNLGIPIIDEHHRGIVTIINSLHYGINHHSEKIELAAVIDIVYDYTRIHFRAEEGFFNIIDYPHAGEHHELHMELSLKLSSIGRQSLLEREPLKLMDFLKEWWINHICHEDLVWKNFLLNTNT